ncbi:unnamed protein product (macronuclear) [Paramecium tetraurelia]|uniref:BZIP domain-containing protein n=1 Tax=Paramecium tetraurelia TaxID=5888 RepID=A0DG00_PARTE|nr:uncharacterized protein GSPATT00002095001 [Paramecium tetraurelia]CAK81967.1 unnamed protein product [Paramecium tetraurelia]|eukprot:XP_001449364.1 hypothetical protein (macronuclear) [Paramecium tetraurelia strain d4-2]
MLTLPPQNSIYGMTPQNISEQEAFHEKWLFGFEEQNPFLPTFEYLNTVFPQKKIKKEEEIICQNKELFNVNQSKSIYLSKITQLIDTEITPKHTKRNGDKWKRKMKQAGDSSEEPFGANTHQLKLARNRQSARDSRKRKKIYIELLENKVEELTQEMLRLQATIANQNNYINYCAKIPSMIKEFHMNYQNQLLNLKNSPCQSQLRILDQEFGVQSIRRIELCNSFFNTLMDHAIPNDLKKIMESAMKGQDFFNEQDPSFKANPKNTLKETQRKFVEETKRLEFYMFDMAKNFEKVRQQSFTLEQLKQEALKDISPKAFAQYLVNINPEQQGNVIKEEDAELSSLQSP